MSADGLDIELKPTRDLALLDAPAMPFLNGLKNGH
jgi:hypothetical protein